VELHQPSVVQGLTYQGTNLPESDLSAIDLNSREGFSKLTRSSLSARRFVTRDVLRQESGLEVRGGKAAGATSCREHLVSQELGQEAAGGMRFLCWNRSSLA